jgi:DNA-binding transcriptional LysR family regulator
MGSGRSKYGTWKTLFELSSLHIFVEIVEAGSLSAASRSLDIPKATVSRHLADLERKLGFSLLMRSSRDMQLTEAGQRYFERIRPLVYDARQIDSEMALLNAEPSGLIRVAAPIAYGQSVLLPRVLTFLKLHPAVRIDLRLSEDRENLISKGIDLAIRLGTLEDSELVAGRLDLVQTYLAASPDYLAACEPIGNPRDLEMHDAILTTPALADWQIGDAVIRPRWRVSVGTMDATLQTCLAGFGIARLPAFIAQKEIDAGRLVRVLPDEDVPKIPMTLLRPRGVPTPAVTAFIKHLYFQRDGVS